MNLLARALRERPDLVQSLLGRSGAGELLNLERIELTLDATIPHDVLATDSAGAGGLWTFAQKEWDPVVDALPEAAPDAPLTHWIELMIAPQGDVGLLVPDDTLEEPNWSYASHRNGAWRVVSVRVEVGLAAAIPEDRAPCDLDPQTGECINYDCDAACEHAVGQTPFGQRVPCCACPGRRLHVGFVERLKSAFAVSEPERETVH